ncbi:similar to Saccharomyces cerevisiae YOR138C RUP1 Protein involved in regulation of Rsp5p, which is an essential HECT ubiquitin ligase [Maudiozyma barnettii]|uniref:Similar to Saccharomyces cerevisiae YOR138C RUP1 Protein involved in regulation of Rsp5p, which is an essential HECT ubiquitin ligase n=1 Tax=Maudiozyma barnettii TaxID=61262 RepID=A0A8H2VBL0_9SACH|nr:Rup1p [Kazachstania barnettii]CAB4252263.1 similar to Saccharomyces cerevisiae YOR138C RUP1 Protein involved in regulation of Rsp5p, which is an essential HECT ubiquitin ligase [Kazachstania barnettii]CAD1778945.1 similar to Saccharomyces cerevisiae YOR138C RUP1 Protein involved in regulation of Rsp5p, which is an essential HECT ubiquitin ligase [Kazachstania barnettii]
MSDNWDVTSLMEMGIDHDVAMDAMKRVNGNLQDAVNFIFSNELPEHLTNNNINNNNNGTDDKARNIDSVPLNVGPIDLSVNPTHNDKNSNEKPSANDLIDFNSSESSNSDFNMHTDNENLTNSIQLRQDSVSQQQIPQTKYIPSGDSSVASSESSSILSGSGIEHSKKNATDSCEQLESSNNDWSEEPPSYSIMQHSIHKTEINDPTVLTPLPVNSVMENYLALYALAMAYYASNLFLLPDFKNLNYDESWYKGNKISEPLYKLKFSNDSSTDPSSINESLDIPKKVEIVQSSSIEYPSESQPETLWQLQKLISACCSKFSERSFVSAKLISKSFDSNVQQKLAEAEHVHEVLPTFIKSLITDLQLCSASDASSISKTFVSTAVHKPSSEEPFQETYLTLFHFLPEEYDSTLYKMFNVLLYPEEAMEYPNGSDSDDDDDDDERDSSLKVISPIFTVLLSEMDETTNDNMAYTDGIDIPFEFYPQIYTKKCKDQLIKHIIEKRNNAHFELRSILNDLNKLKSYQGKDLFMFLNSTLEYLQQDEKVSNEKGKEILSIISQIESIKTQINEKKDNKKDQYKEISQKLHNEWNLTYPETHIIKTAKQLNLIDSPYLLSMLVISPHLYFLRDRLDKNKWTQVKCNTIGTDFRISKSITEVQLKEYIKQCTRAPNETPIMFTYIKEDFYNEQQTSLARNFENNEGCQQFHKADQLYLLSTK